MTGVSKITLFAKLRKVDAEGRSKLCGGKKRSCEVCKSVNDHFPF